MHENNRHTDHGFSPEPAKYPDPVCGMRIDPAHSAGTRMMRGKSVFFCSTLCLEKFDISPEHYANLVTQAHGEPR